MRHLEYVPLADLVPDERNPKLHSGDLRESMDRFGYTEPIMVDERTGKMVAGHGRREQLVDAAAAGREPPEGVEVADDGGWLVPVVRGWSSVDDDEALAYVIASNRIPERGGWLADELADALGKLAGRDGGLAGIGYSTEETDRLLSGIPGGDPLPPVDPPPPTPDGPRREVQGLHEVGLIFRAEHYRDYQRLVVELKQRWEMEATPAVVLRAMRQARTDG